MNIGTRTCGAPHTTYDYPLQLHVTQDKLTTDSQILPLLLASTYHVLATSTTYNLLIAYFLSFPYSLTR